MNILERDMMPSTNRYFLISLLVMVFISLPLSATQIDPLMWEQFAAEADFIGIVECSVAGGVVAKYKVIESWKGPAKGTDLYIKLGMDYVNTQFPITLVGERYLFAAFKSQAPENRVASLMGSVPYWWRQMPVTHYTPLWQGRELLPLGPSKARLGSLGSERQDLASFKADIQNFLSLSPKVREARMLKLMARKYLLGQTKSHLFQDKPNWPDADFKHLSEVVDRNSNPKQIVSAVLQLGRSVPPDYRRHRTIGVLEQGGGAETLKLVEQEPLAYFPFGEVEKNSAISSIKRRIGIAETSVKAPREEGPPTPQKLGEMRKVLSTNPTQEQFSQVFGPLTAYDPESVAKYLLTWSDTPDRPSAYEIGSYFGARCGRDREKLLRSLLEAKEPFIQVAASVYLSFENQALAQKELKNLCNLPGTPGAWAALSLVRRGDKSAMIRALELLQRKDYGYKDRGFRKLNENFALELIVLLSNSAAYSKLPQPSPPVSPESVLFGIKGTDQLYTYYTAWWAQNSDRVNLFDPWLADLQKQKID